MLAAMFSGRHRVDKDTDGNFFIDRDGTYFIYILNYLRNEGDLPPVVYAEEVLKEALFYGLWALVEHLKSTPALFSEYCVRENVRSKLEDYNEIKDLMISLAKDQVTEGGAITSVVRLVTTKNQPVPRDLQFSKQVYKQYYRKFRTYENFESCFGKYHINVPSEKVKGHPDTVMDLVAGCLSHDLLKAGYKGLYKSESIRDEDNRIKTISWSDGNFHVCMTCHMFRFDWLDLSGRK